MNMFSNLLEYFGIYQEKDYTALTKKDEDLDLDKVQQWISNYPVNEAKNLRNTSLEKIKTYTNDLMNSLKKEVSITSINAKAIENHLVQIYKGNSLLWRQIILKVLSLKGDKEVVRDLHSRLACHLW